MTAILENLSQIPLADLQEVYFGQAIYPPGGTHGPRIQRGVQIFHLLSGSVTFTIEGQDTVLSPGQMCLLLPGRHEFHQFSLNEESTHTWCQLDFVHRPDELTPLFAKVPAVIDAHRDLERFMSLGLSLTRSAQIHTHESLMHFGKSLLDYFIASANRYHQSKDNQPVPRSVRIALDYISVHFAKDLSLDHLAGVSHISVNHLIDLFKRHVGTTPNRYLWQIRCERAKQLLLETNIPITHVAEQSGFSSPYHFSRAFKAAFGVSPRACRQGNS